MTPSVLALPMPVRVTAMSHLQRMVERIALAPINVLVLGETGAGKEVLAHRIHEMSPRAGAPFLRLSCAALSEQLLESELFGHERGAFAGALAPRAGLLESACGGTLFLDDLGELPLAIQTKLLRAIETRQALRIGGLRPKELDVRFIAATSVDLDADATRGAFRRDLYFRISAATLVVPPLRQRRAEIAELAHELATDAAHKLGTPPAVLAPDAIAVLEAHDWPGNIRELRNVIELAVLLAPDGIIGAAQLPAERLRPPPEPATAATPATHDELAALRRRIGELERVRILDALAQCGGNQTRAAKLLEMPRRTLVSKLARYDLPRPRKR